MSIINPSPFKMLRLLQSHAPLRPPRALSVSFCRFVSSQVSSGADRVAEGAPQSPVHVPVLLQETVAAFTRNSKTCGGSFHFVDGTAGFGGHSRAILQHFPDAKLLCIDRDPEVLSIAQANLSDFHGRVSFCNGSYADLAAHLKASGFPDEVDGILVDLGANSFHFDAARRGFSVLHDGPLDMRFDQRDAALPTAADAVNILSEVQLTKIFKEYGEEKLAKEFAKAIVREREEKSKVFRTTKDLRECIERIANMWRSSDKGKKAKKSKKAGSTHPATRCFQALRIYVNDELNHVETGVQQLITHLAPHGRLVTIAFHSLEDRPIKDIFRKLDKHSREQDSDDDDEWGDDDFDEDEPNDLMSTKQFRLIRRKATKATAEEIAANARARSARLRCLERVL
ncbi:putative methyltransferase-like protein 15 [Phytophthora boehmeriae]|uniref:Putative methyltransferase-like protein 15 n=1 Tax=Phytophthora boehmeriae TaxID=109152 RepID=A0A8T1X5E6_9STRA|nr:putative methyltransferase-like protein 15 [Phytophthora boehmeriae]